jgi:CHAT domain
MSHRKARVRLRHGLWLGLAVLLMAFGPADPRSASQPAPSTPALEVEFSGCWAFYWPGAVCALWPGPDPQLTFWVKAEPTAKVEIHAGDQPLPAEGEEVGGGTRYRLSIPGQASVVTVSVSSPDGDEGPSWSLRLAEPDMPAWMAEIANLEKPQARRRLEQLLKTASPKERTHVLRMLAILTRDDQEEASNYLNFLKQGMAVDRAENRLSGEVEKTGWLLAFYLERSRFNEAREVLQKLKLPAEAPAESKYFLAFYQGLLGEAVGDYRVALDQLRRATELAERVGMRKYRQGAEQILARVLQSLGRSKGSTDLYERLLAEADPKDLCPLGTLLTNVGWSRLLAREAGEETKNPIPALQQARASFDDGDCGLGKRLNAHLNLAFAYEQTGHWPEARQALEEARSVPVKPNREQRLWWDDLEARPLIHEGRPELALHLYQQLEMAAERELSPEGRLRASLGQARAHLALGERKAAIAALDDAERRIDEQSWQIPVQEGRETFIAQREDVTRLHLETLIEDQQMDRAFAVARRARSRLLRQLIVRDRLAQLSSEQQQEWNRRLSKYSKLRADIDREAAEDWQLASDQKKRAREARARQLGEAKSALDAALDYLGDPGEMHEDSLSRPGPGEVILLYHPMREGWVGFAATRQGVDAARLKLPPKLPADPGELARGLLEPFHSAIAASRRIRVLPYGRLWSVDFHALDFAGEPLFKRHVVVYGLDLPVPTSPAPPTNREALLVTNPTSDLPAAKREGNEVAGVIKGSRWKLKWLDGPAASADAVRRALPGVELFHYAGHGKFDGFAGWDSTLKLADESRLMLGEILTLEHSPTWVVLSSCDGGRSSEQAPGEGVGLAQAFLLAGSQAVIAATRLIDDRPARELMVALYRDWQPGLDLPGQLQKAQIARSQDPTADSYWTSFRVFVP